jgi:hypothetical protein
LERVGLVPLPLYVDTSPKDATRRLHSIISRRFSKKRGSRFWGICTSDYPKKRNNGLKNLSVSPYSKSRNGGRVIWDHREGKNRKPSDLLKMSPTSLHFRPNGRIKDYC